MFRYHIFNKYFVNKFNTPSLYQEIFLNKNVKKIKWMYWFNNIIVTDNDNTYFKQFHYFQ